MYSTLEYIGEEDSIEVVTGLVDYHFDVINEKDLELDRVELIPRRYLWLQKNKKYTFSLDKETVNLFDKISSTDSLLMLLPGKYFINGWVSYHTRA